MVLGEASPRRMKKERSAATVVRWGESLFSHKLDPVP
jgi:hypothetical protein